MKNKNHRSQIQTNGSFPDRKQISENNSYHHSYPFAIRVYRNRKSPFAHIPWQLHKTLIIVPHLFFSYDKRSRLKVNGQRNSGLLNISFGDHLITLSPPHQASITFVFTTHNSHPTGLKLTVKGNNSADFPPILNLPRPRDQRQHHPILFPCILRHKRATPFPARCYKVARSNKTASSPPPFRP